MEVIKTLLVWVIKFVRYLTLNVLIGGLLDRVVFDPLNRVMLSVLEGDGGSGDEGGWVGELPGESGGQGVGGIGRQYSEGYGRGYGQV